ncbi:MAG: hydroxymethylglutaryl-CoA synthase, partial [Gammaproteobacteria bacterium]|nr:hydroxymethylglutaryl-CoA synthase [Gammaproteobacteria bacterium]
GAVIVKGMIDEALLEKGMQPLSRNCEVPEFKHACLGGIYGIKNAIRFLNTDGHDSKAIVVCSDIALYGLGSSGEPTQGAGAVAMLLETDPKLATMDLSESGSASDYRGLDFRKPIQYRNGSGQTCASSNIPVFNGRYSASCYIDEMAHALDDMFARRGLNAEAYQGQVEAIFMHRPFRRMPENGWGMAYLFGLAANTNGGQEELRSLCDEACVDFGEVLQEINGPRQVSGYAVREKIRDEIFPLLNKVLRQFRKHSGYKEFVLQKMSLGTGIMEELGNLYSGALPAWFAAGLEEAARNSIDLANKEVLLIGYGSGDAAEAIPVRIVDGWRDVALRIGIEDAMANAVDLNEKQYISLRQGSAEDSLTFEPKDEFVVDRIGSLDEEGFQDTGIEYYRYIN